MSSSTPSPSAEPNGAAAIWQGWRHAWEYNHRLNRFGSYVVHRRGLDGATRAFAGHTAASGTGDDTAHFTEFVTKVSCARGVAFQAGWAETVVECQRGDLTAFVIRIDDLELEPALQGRDIVTVVLNGFDLCALQHADKLVTFDVDVTEPVVYAGGTRARFYIVGSLRFDCRSPECQLLPIRLESEATDGHEEDEMVEPTAPAAPPERPRWGIDRRRVDRAALWLKRQLVTLMGVDEVKQTLLTRDADSTRRRLFRFGRRCFFIRFLKWELAAPYRIRVQYLLIGGDREALSVQESDTFEHQCSWDLEHEIHHEQAGVLPVRIDAANTGTFSINTLAFRRLVMDVQMNESLGTEDPIQWGKGMYLLEWSMAVRDIHTAEDGIQATLDLFFKCWSEAMNERITLMTWGAVRGAGSARFAARLALLQFKDAVTDGQARLPGRLYWPGAGLSARNDPRARCERAVSPAVEQP